jgi:serine phosphatase RsbU (regulator of sigma subunit)/catechol 2,3-dioxygenase-like lactoylglutathione lyase family enzyme
MADTQQPERSDILAVRLDRERPYLRLLSATIYVRDQDVSLRFFVDKLGFSLTHDVQVAPGFRWVAVSPPDGDAFLAIVTPMPGSEEHKFIGCGRNVAFIAEDVTARCRELSARGVHFQQPPQASPVGGVFAVFEDPDGNRFTVLGFDNVTQAIEAQRLALAEKLEAERRAAQELEIARQVQARLFPQMLPHIQFLDYAGICIQAHAVGGDYYDFLDLGRGRLGLVIGDIAGKGIAAALLMANLQANLRSQSAVALQEPQRMLQSVNRLFFENTIDSAYATLVFAEYDEALRRLRYINCGHLPALVLRRDGTVERLHSTTTVLGLSPSWDSSIHEYELGAGDLFVLYTDGVTEAASCETGEEFGEERLIDALRRHRDLSATALLDSVTAEILRFCPSHQFDDITLIVCKQTG